MAVLCIFIDRNPHILTPNLDNADPRFTRVITPGFYLHRLQVAYQDPTSGSLSAKVVVTSRLVDLIVNNSQRDHIIIFINLYDT